MDSCERLSKFVYDLTYEDLPTETVENVRLFLADYVCAAMAGKKVNTVFNRAVEAFTFAQSAEGKSSVLFSNRQLPAAKAAFLNACYAHGADMDDGNRKAMGHVGAHVFSTVLALGEELGSDEREIITAAVAGYDVYCRVAAAAQPGLVHRGFHSTGTAGVIACAAAAAKLMKADKERIYHAMAISVTMASGLMIVAESGQSIKPLNPAKAAENGILAATLAMNGVEGGNLPLESTKGWFHAMSDEIDHRMITEGLGKTFSIDESYIKPYPSCRHTHGAIQAVLELKKEYALSAEKIKAIRVYIYPNAIRIAGQIHMPKTSDDSKFSIHYATACAAVLGRFTLNELDSHCVPESVIEMIGRIELIPDETMENRDEGIRGCRVEIEDADGKHCTKTVLIPKGDPQNAFTVDDMREKMAQCAEGIYSHKAQERLMKKLFSFGSTTGKKVERITE